MFGKRNKSAAEFGQTPAANYSSIRVFFDSSLSSTVVLQIAQEIGYLPRSIRLSQRGSSIKVHSLENLHNEDYEGLQSPVDEAGFVKGTRLRIPPNCPETKYAALFDPREEFHSLRATFMVYSDPASTPARFLQTLESRDVLPSHHEFHIALRDWCTSASINDEPPDFGSRAWAVYLETIRSPS